MARLRPKLLTSAIRAPFWKRFGIKSGAATTANAPSSEDWAYDNTYEMRFRNAADTDDVRALSVDASNNILVAESKFVPLRLPVTFNLATAASITTQQFFIVPYACRVVSITEIHATAESTATTLTGYVGKLGSGVAAASATAVMSSTFNLKGTANTQQTATLAGDDSDGADRQLAAGDRLAWVQSAASTELAGLSITITLAPGGAGQTAVYNMQANGDLVDQHFFIANTPMIVSAIYECHSTLGTNGSAVTIDVKKATSTQAAASGTTLLTTTFDAKASINVVRTGTLTATTANLRMNPGDRLSIDYTGTLTALAGVVVVVVFEAIPDRAAVTWSLSKNANLGVDQVFFTADRRYKIVASSGVWGVAAGGASTLQVTRDKGTDAPGAGIDLLASTGYDINGTAETVAVRVLEADWTAVLQNYLLTGDRLSVDFANAAQASAGVTVTVSLEPA